MAEPTTTIKDLVEEFKTARAEDKKNIIIQAAELQDKANKEEKRDEKLQELLDQGIKKQLGETGFRGVIKASKEGFTTVSYTHLTLPTLYSV